MKKDVYGKTDNTQNAGNTVSQQDIDFLSMMCSLCSVVTKKRLILPDKNYLYYVPGFASELIPAQKLFAKYGVKMSVHNSQIIDEMGQDVLRVSYDTISNRPEILDMVEQIRVRRLNLYSQKNMASRYELRQQLEEYKRKCR